MCAGEHSCRIIRTRNWLFQHFYSFPLACGSRTSKASRISMRLLLRAFHPQQPVSLVMCEETCRATLRGQTKVVERIGSSGISSRTSGLVVLDICRNLGQGPAADRPLFSLLSKISKKLQNTFDLDTFSLGLVTGVSTRVWHTFRHFADETFQIFKYSNIRANRDNITVDRKLQP